MFVVIARYRTSVEHAATVAALLVPLAQASRLEPGNRSYEVLGSAEDPCEFRILEHYLDRAAFDAHLESAHYNEIAVAQIRPLLTERQADFWTELPGSVR
ncbi:MAG: putative quinol monooxygenase [Sporichthyaceae bacterium]